MRLNFHPHIFLIRVVQGALPVEFISFPFATILWSVAKDYSALSLSHPWDINSFKSVVVTKQYYRFAMSFIIQPFSFISRPGLVHHNPIPRLLSWYPGAGVNIPKCVLVLPLPCYKCNINKYLIPVFPFPFVFLTLTTIIINSVPVLSIIGPVALIFISIYIKIAPLPHLTPFTRAPSYLSPFLNI